MKLLILSADSALAGKDRMYRGTYRTSPYYHEERSENHHINQTFLKYVNAGSALGVLDDLYFAKEVVTSYQQLEPPENFEIVEVTRDQERPETEHNKLLGYDITCALHYSLLSEGFDLCNGPRIATAEDHPYWTIQPLICLIEKFFDPQLNANGLFDTYSAAKFCLDCMMALQKIVPNLWESPTAKFEVVGVWEVLA